MSGTYSIAAESAFPARIRHGLVTLISLAVVLSAGPLWAATSTRTHTPTRTPSNTPTLTPTVPPTLTPTPSQTATATNTAGPPPILNTSKTAVPLSECEEAQITLNVSGAGTPQTETVPLDVELVLDTSFSMNGTPA